jgi:hypothetical protein
MDVTTASDKAQLVMKGNRMHQGFHFMEAVRAAAQNVEEKIDFAE